jgi:hypothetical protein
MPSSRTSSLSVSPALQFSLSPKYGHYYLGTTNSPSHFSFRFHTFFIYLCNKSGPDAPHIITQATNDHHKARYPSDYKLFHPNSLCTICKIPKLARSRHCSRCGVCVARADHHCVWVNNCIGRGNYKYFLALLLSTTVLLSYTVYLTCSTVLPQVLDHVARSDLDYSELPMFTFLEHLPGTGGESMVRLLEGICGWLYAVSAAVHLGGVTRLCIGFLAMLAMPLPAGLLVFHIRLVWNGMTTIEYERWNDWREEIAEGTAFLAPLVIKNNEESCQDILHGWDEKSPWPKRSQDFLVLTDDGLPPRNLNPEIVKAVGENARWRRCRSLEEVENVYDLGVWENVRENFLH